MFGASAGSIIDLFDQAAGDLNGGLNGFPRFGDDPLIEEYRSAMEDGGVPESTRAGPHSTALYAAMRLVQKAVVGHADPEAPLDRAAVLAAMYSVEDEDLDGLLAGPVSHREDDLDRTRNCFWPYIKNVGEDPVNPGRTRVHLLPRTGLSWHRARGTRTRPPGEHIAVEVGDRRSRVSRRCPNNSTAATAARDARADARSPKGPDPGHDSGPARWGVAAPTALPTGRAPSSTSACRRPADVEPTVGGLGAASRAAVRRATADRA